MLLRSSQPLLPFLAPSAYRTSAASRISDISRHYRPHQWRQHQVVRSITTNCPRRQQSGGAKKSDESTSFDFSKLLDDALDHNKGVPTASTGRTSHFQSPNAQRTNPPSGRQGRLNEEGDKPSTSELDDFFAAADKTPRRQQQQQQVSQSTSSWMAGILDPQNNTRAGKSNPPPPAPYVPEPSPIKLNSSVGRTISVNSQRGMDVGRAFRALEIQCARNSVKRDFMRQRFHERPGLKRKRLKSERWRRRFKEQFRGTVQMVQRMKAQGW